MKLYVPAEPIELIRINIKQQGEETKFITICEASQNEVYDFVKSIIEKQNISVFTKGKLLNIEMRQAKGGQNGKSISLSFKGMTPSEVYSLILDNLKED